MLIQTSNVAKYFVKYKGAKSVRPWVSTPSPTFSPVLKALSNLKGVMTKGLTRK